MPHTQLSQFRNIFPGETFYIVGRGPSLWNWSRDKGIFWNAPTIFMNSAIHFLGPYKPEEYAKYPENIFRIIMDVKGIDHYLNAQYYKNLQDHRMPNCHTFVSFHMIDAITWEMKKKINAIDFTCYYIARDGIIPLNFLRPSYLWGPTLFSAISLAAHMGAKEIHLVAIDYGCNGPLTHWDMKAGEGSVNTDTINRWGESMQDNIIRKVEPILKRSGITLRQFAGPHKEICLGEKGYE